MKFGIALLRGISGVLEEMHKGGVDKKSLPLRFKLEKDSYPRSFTNWSY